MSAHQAPLQPHKQLWALYSFQYFLMFITDAFLYIDLLLKDGIAFQESMFESGH